MINWLKKYEQAKNMENKKNLQIYKQKITKFAFIVKNCLDDGRTCIYDDGTNCYFESEMANKLGFQVVYNPKYFVIYITKKDLQRLELILNKYNIDIE